MYNFCTYCTNLVHSQYYLNTYYSTYLNVYYSMYYIMYYITYIITLIKRAQPKGNSMPIEQQILTITKYTNLDIDVNRIRIGVDPSGIKPSQFITYYEPNSIATLQNALAECISYLTNHNKYWEES